MIRVFLAVVLTFATPAFGCLLAQEPTAGVATLIDLDGEVDLSTAAYVRRALDRAVERHHRLVIVRINTFGGRVDAATHIRDAIVECPLPTIAFVDDRAISAGALIALSCLKIAMMPGATIGAVTPVGSTGARASEKVVSYMRGEMRALAERRGRDVRIAEAMVDESIDLADTLLKARGQLITLTTSEALRVGYCDVEATDYPSALTTLGYASTTVEPVPMSWTELAAQFLTSPVIASLLIVIGMGGIFYTIKTGHIGSATAAGAAAMILFFAAQYTADLATILEVAVFIVGIVLLLLEIFVIPGFGVAGVTGIVLVIAGLFLSLIGSYDNLTWETLTQPLYTLAGAFIGLAVVLYLMFRYLPDTGAFRKFVLSDTQPSAKGFVSSPDYSDLVGSVGSAVTTLRPAGLAEVNGERYDVVTDGEYIAAGVAIEVTHVEGRKVVVRRADTDMTT